MTQNPFESLVSDRLEKRETGRRVEEDRNRIEQKVLLERIDKNKLLLDSVIDTIILKQFDLFRESFEKHNIGVNVWVKKSHETPDKEPLMQVSLRKANLRDKAAPNIVAPMIDFRFSPDFSEIEALMNFKPVAVVNMQDFDQTGWGERIKFKVEGLTEEQFQGILGLFVTRAEY